PPGKSSPVRQRESTSHSRLTTQSPPTITPSLPTPDPHAPKTTSAPSTTTIRIIERNIRPPPANAAAHSIIGRYPGGHEVERSSARRLPRRARRRIGRGSGRRG